MIEHFECNTHKYTDNPMPSWIYPVQLPTVDRQQRMPVPSRPCGTSLDRIHLITHYLTRSDEIISIAAMNSPKTNTAMAGPTRPTHHPIHSRLDVSTMVECSGRSTVDPQSFLSHSPLSQSDPTPETQTIPSVPRTRIRPARRGSQRPSGWTQSPNPPNPPPDEPRVRLRRRVFVVGYAMTVRDRDHPDHGLGSVWSTETAITGQEVGSSLPFILIYFLFFFFFLSFISLFLLFFGFLHSIYPR